MDGRFLYASFRQQAEYSGRGRDYRPAASSASRAGMPEL